MHLTANTPPTALSTARLLRLSRCRRRLVLCALLQLRVSPSDEELLRHTPVECVSKIAPLMSVAAPFVPITGLSNQSAVVTRRCACMSQAAWAVSVWFTISKCCLRVWTFQHAVGTR